MDRDSLGRPAPEPLEVGPRPRMSSQQIERIAAYVCLVGALACILFSVLVGLSWLASGGALEQDMKVLQRSLAEGKTAPAESLPGSSGEGLVKVIVLQPANVLAAALLIAGVYLFVGSRTSASSGRRFCD